VNEKEVNHLAHPMDRMANWCSPGGWFTGQSELTATNAPVGRSVH